MRSVYNEFSDLPIQAKNTNYLRAYSYSEISNEGKKYFILLNSHTRNE